MNETDEKWMHQALNAARAAGEAGEVPIGACIVGPDGNLLASGGNLTITNSDPTAHAEIVILRHAGATTGNYRLTGATVYSTIEPCAMCAGALVNARIGRLVYGARDERFGAVETHFRICDSPLLNHRIEITAGVLEDECRFLVQEFFRKKREIVKMKNFLTNDT